MIYLVVKNIGQSVAKKVRLTFYPMLQTSFNISLGEMSFIKNGIESMPPGFEIRTLVDSTSSYFSNPNFPLKYNVKIIYFGGVEETERIYEQTLDLSAQKGLMYIRPK
jgi:hypothetical protein